MFAGYPYRKPTQVDEERILAGNFVKKTEAIDLKGRLIALSNAAFEDGKLMNLPVVPTRLLLEEELSRNSAK